MKKRDYLPLFKVRATHGLKGDLKVTLLTTNEEILSGLNVLYLKNEWENPLKIRALKRGPGAQEYILSLEDIEYAKAKELVNQVLFIAVKDLPPEKEGFYYYQLEDLLVKDASGKVWGRVREIMPMGEYELLLIQAMEGEEFYLPLVEEYVEKIDLEEKTIWVKDIQALVESQR